MTPAGPRWVRLALLCSVYCALQLGQCLQPARAADGSVTPLSSDPAPAPANGSAPPADLPSAVPASYRLGDTLTAAQMPGLRVSTERFSIGSGLGLLPAGQEIVLSTNLALARLPDGFYTGGLYAGTDPVALRAGFDAPRATYRYTFLESTSWAWRVGLTAPMNEPQLALGAGGIAHYTGLPLMHLSSSGRLGQRWQLNVDADGMRTAHGRALDLDLRLDYGVASNLYVYGGYRLFEAGGDAEDAYAFAYGSPPTNSANVGIRYRF